MGGYHADDPSRLWPLFLSVCALALLAITMPQFGVALAQPQQRQAHQEQSRVPRRIIGVDYGPFGPGQQPGGPCPTLEEITADMPRLKRMAPVTRIYGLRDCGIGEKVLKATNKFREMPAAGLWLGAPFHK